MSSQDDIRDYIINWNVRFPYDRQWRKKYNIPFKSAVHKEISFLDQLLDLEEDRIFEELAAKEEYIPDSGDWLKVPEITKDNMQESIQSFREEFKDLTDDDNGD